MQKSTVREEENTDTSQAEKHCQRRREHRHKPSRKAQSEKKRTRHKPSRKAQSEKKRTQTQAKQKRAKAQKILR
jgi:hypothetical protein